MAPSIDIPHVLTRQVDRAGPIQRAITNLKKVGEANLTLRRVRGRLEQLRLNWQEFKDNHNQLVEFRATCGDKTTRQTIDSHDYFTNALYDDVEQSYLDAQEYMECRIDAIHAEDPTSGAAMAERSMINEGVQVQTPRLKPIELPQFGGEPREWTSFRDLFQALVGLNPQLTNVAKLHYLKTSLTGIAATRIESIGLTNDNFAVAWDYLASIYDDKRLLINTAMRDLMEARPVTKSNGEDLDRYTSEVSRAITALETLGQSSPSCDAYIIYIVVSKLDPDTVKEWEESLGSTQLLPTWVKLLKFLESRARALRAWKFAKGGSQPNAKPQQIARTHHAATGSNSTSPSNGGSKKPPMSGVNKPCANCSGAHYTGFCPSLLSKTVAQRRAVIQAKQLCFNCLRSHRVNDCQSKGRCQQCNEKHHTLLHQPASNDGSSSPPASTASSQAGASTSTTAAISNHAISQAGQYQEVLLTTASVRVEAPGGSSVLAKALIDSGSELSFISEALAQLLKLPRRRVDIPLVGIGGISSGTTRGAVSFTVCPHFKSDFRCKVDAVTLSTLTADLSSRRVSTGDWSHLRGLRLADPDYASTGRIDLILGADIYGQLLKSGVKRGPIESPVAQSTELGWILSGPCSSNRRPPLQPNDQTLRPVHGLHCAVERTPMDNELHELVQRFWSQEETTSLIGTSLSPDEEACEAHFLATHSRDSTGRYIVRLPFRTSPEELGDSRVCANRVLSRLQKRFTTESTLQDSYRNFLEQYEQLGHMRRVPDAESESSAKFYLPHHGVLKASSTTTKLRVVFNGSARSSTGKSLNDLLHVGAKLQTNLTDVILRWRRAPFVFSTDIEKMFRQIKVHPEDWRFQRILWAPRPSEDTATYELTTVTYGLGPAPFLAIRTLHQLAADEGHRFPLAASILQNGTYVDDAFGGANTLLEAQHAAQQLDELCKAGGFSLHKWTANYAVVLSKIPPDRRETAATVVLEEDNLVSTLGISWRPSTDSFEFSSSKASHQPPFTKRKVLSRIAQLFDPLGWISPVIIRAKILMQDLWTAKIDWDDELPTHLLALWTDFVDTMSDFPPITIPRWLGLSPSAINVELHGFSDASENAMAAVVFLRILRDDADDHVSLVCSKTKVAPLKRLTIPRLELTAALILARQAAKIRTTLGLENSTIHLWTDSTVALTWISGPASRWRDFVRNRVSAIHEALPDARWHHVPGKDNPADCASRGLTPQQLHDHHLWWSGPAWLSLPPDTWPTATPNTDSVDLEERRKVITVAVTRPTTSWDVIHRFSSWTRLLRVTATCRRFFRRRSPLEHPLTPLELASEAQFWIKMAQEEYFSSELKLLSSGRVLPTNSSLLRLAPFLDEGSGILKLGGRLNNALLEPDSRHPVIIPKESPLATLLIADAHARTLHGGTQATLAYIRRSYWILGGRTPVRSYILRCVRCARQRGQAAQQRMGQLPFNRANPSRAFLHTGVDYAGPFTLKAWRGRTSKTYKTYVVVFVCFATSAIHLEAVSDYSTAGFLAAFRRFTGRRGICATLTSDCGTNFVGADRELRQMFDQTSDQLKSLAALVSTDGTTWKFNPPSAPHFGGKWEAGVKSLKFHLRRVIGAHLLTFEELSTLLVQIEAALNSRPLTPLSDDPDDLNALTPGHFLIGSAISLIPEPSLNNIAISRLSRWQLITQMTEHFWSRWSLEYLQHLQGVSKWHRVTNNVRIGTLVLIIDERFPPSKWPLARVTAIHPGPDALTRVVTVRTATSTFRRPIAKLCIVPVDTEEKPDPTT